MEIYFTKLRPLVKPTVFSPPYPFALTPPQYGFDRSILEGVTYVQTEGITEVTEFYTDYRAVVNTSKMKISGWILTY